MKTKIAVDLDGVLAADLDRLVDAMNQRLGTALSPDQVDRYDVGEVWGRHGVDPGSARQVLEQLHGDPEWVADTPLMLPMVTVMRRLAGLTIEPDGPVVLTARPPHLREVTRQWLDSYGLPYSRVVHTTDKAAWCRAERVSYHLEDSPEQAIACQQAGVAVFLVDWPYNRQVEATGRNGIWRVVNPVVVPELIWQDLNQRGSQS